jgi:hypothetical protein
MKEGPGSYFLNRSIVVHFANKTRITCANFAVLHCPANATTAGNGSCLQAPSPVTTPTTTPTTIPITAPVQAGAGMLTVLRGLAVLPVVAMLFGL